MECQQGFQRCSPGFLQFHGVLLFEAYDCHDLHSLKLTASLPMKNEGLEDDPASFWGTFGLCSRADFFSVMEGLHSGNLT